MEKPNYNNYLINIGCLKYILNNSDYFYEYKAIFSLKLVLIANSLVLPQGMGTISIRVIRLNRKYKNLKLNKVYYFPTFLINLLSSLKLYNSGRYLKDN